MCAIFGYLETGTKESAKEILDRMASMLRHRGPDDRGEFLSERAALGHLRLSLVGLNNGKQPFSGADSKIQAVCAGEIFNFPELKKELEQKGHVFKTQSDCETLIRLYEEYGIEGITKINGQFAAAIWDGRQNKLYLARDRFGIAPLFFTQAGKSLVFASEIKALLCFPGVHARFNAQALQELSTFWSAVGQTTFFQDIHELPPAHWLCADASGISLQKYWQLDFQENSKPKSADYYREGLKAHIERAVRLRLQADVPIGLYLSGGLDSSYIGALAARNSGIKKAFSIRYDSSLYDEGDYQKEAREALGLEGREIFYNKENSITLLTKAVWHAEKPVLRTALLPMLCLSQKAHEAGYKAVLAGEGADEFLLGYEIYKEIKIRDFCARLPRSSRRAYLYNRIYPELPLSRTSGESMATHFFSQALPADFKDFPSHALRWKASSALNTLFSREVTAGLNGHDSIQKLKKELPPAYSGWGHTAQAEYLESSLFLKDYLLGSQGDRMSMANAVEVRYPYLDHELVEYCNRVPAAVKMPALKDKQLLRRCASEILPSRLAYRPKKYYEAPPLLLTAEIRERLSEKNVKKIGLFDASAVSRLVKKLESGLAPSQIDTQALNLIISTALFHEAFMEKDFGKAI